jgi:Arc/MetJ family transcription regulator
MQNRLDRDSFISYYGIMKTTIDIPESALKEAFRHTGAKTKREAVVTALEDFNRRRRMAEAARVLGASDTFITHDQLMQSRVKGRSA